MKPLEKRKDLMSETMIDSMTLLMIGSRLIGMQSQESFFAPFYAEGIMFADFQADDRCR